MLAPHQYLQFYGPKRETTGYIFDKISNGWKSIFTDYVLLNDDKGGNQFYFIINIGNIGHHPWQLSPFVCLVT